MVEEDDDSASSEDEDDDMLTCGMHTRLHTWFVYISITLDMHMHYVHSCTPVNVSGECLFWMHDPVAWLIHIILKVHCAPPGNVYITMVNWTMASQQETMIKKVFTFVHYIKFC